jgi:cell division protein ZapE
MLLGGLLEALFKRNVVLVATSNQHPDQLYYDGLQRDRFLPAISLLKKNTKVVNIDSGIDYRLEFFDHAEIYHSPLDDNANAILEDDFIHVCPDKGDEASILEIEDRKIETVRCGDGVVWFDFKAICAGPRGVADYIEIARQYQTVLIANIPVMNDNDNDVAKRLIILVDEFYDRNVKLIITAEAAPAKLYQGKRLAESFKRTQSRLEEMRTHDYLAKEHLP